MSPKQRSFVPRQVIEAHFITSCSECPHFDTLTYDSDHTICTNQDFNPSGWTGRSVDPDSIPENCPLASE